MGTKGSVSSTKQKTPQMELTCKMRGDEAMIKKYVKTPTWRKPLLMPKNKWKYKVAL